MRSTERRRDTALVLGVLAIAPLLTYRRLHRIDVPAALRVLE